MSEKSTSADPSGSISRLSPTERRCLLLVAQGLSSKDIARETRLSPNTVNNYIASATRKLGVTKRILAAQMVADAAKVTPDVTPSKLTDKNSAIPRRPISPNKGASTGQGDGPEDLEQRNPDWPESHDSERGSAWLEPRHPIAKFFGGENRQPIAQRILWIIVLAIGLGIAFGGVISGLANLSRLFSPS